MKNATRKSARKNAVPRLITRTREEFLMIDVHRRLQAAGMPRSVSMLPAVAETLDRCLKGRPR